MPWMTNLFNNEPGFPNRPLTEIAIPGTHDSGCYVDRLYGYGNFQSRTQTQTIAQQLAGGIRYFDIRPHLTRAQQFWTYHGPFYTGGRLDGNAGILADVQAFMTGLPAGSHELIILNISHFSGFNNVAHANLITAIQTAIGPHLVPYTQAQISLFNTPYVNLLTDPVGQIQSRVAILYDGALDTAQEQYINNNALPAGFFKLGPKYGVRPNPNYLFDRYANKAYMDDGYVFSGMVPDQMDKLANRQNYRYTTLAWGNGLPNWTPNNQVQNIVLNTLHLFSWTLTPQPRTDPITAAQNDANPRLLAQFTGNNWGAGVPYNITVHPKINIIYVDDYSSEIAVNANAPRTGLAMPVAIADFLNRYINAHGNVVWNGWAGF